MPELGGKNFTLRDDVGWPFNDIPEPEVYRRDDCVYADCEEAHLVLGNLSFCNRAAPDKKKIYDRRKCGINLEKIILEELNSIQCNETILNTETYSKEDIMSFVMTGSPAPPPKYIYGNTGKYWEHQVLYLPYNYPHIILTYYVRHWAPNGDSDCYSFLERRYETGDGSYYQNPRQAGEVYVAFEINQKDVKGYWAHSRIDNPDHWQALYQANGLGNFDKDAPRLWIGCDEILGDSGGFILDFFNVSWIDNPVIGGMNTVYSLISGTHMLVGGGENTTGFRGFYIDDHVNCFPGHPPPEFRIKFQKDPGSFKLNEYSDPHQYESRVYNRHPQYLTPTFTSQEVFLPALPSGRTIEGRLSQFS